MPAKLIFKTKDGEMYPVIFKHGDDLRQDQLILQIISLMDKVQYMCLVIYSVLVTKSTYTNKNIPVCVLW